MLESGICDPRGRRARVDAGARAVLVGEALMRAADPGATIRELPGRGRERARATVAPRRAGAVRRLRRPVRARGADPRARRARGGVVELRDDPAFRGELDALLRDFVGRPSALTFAPRLSEPSRLPDLPQARGPEPHRRAQDQQHARPGAARAAARQGADHRRDGRRAARRGDGHRVRALRAAVRRLHGRGGHASGRRRTSPGCSCSAPRSSRSPPAAER